MSALNRREMLRLCAVGSLGAVINESGSTGQATAAVGIAVAIGLTVRVARFAPNHLR
jgi:hypothetical protein